MGFFLFNFLVKREFWRDYLDPSICFFWFLFVFILKKRRVCENLRDELEHARERASDLKRGGMFRVSPRQMGT